MVKKMILSFVELLTLDNVVCHIVHEEFLLLLDGFQLIIEDFVVYVFVHFAVHVCNHVGHWHLPILKFFELQPVTFGALWDSLGLSGALWNSRRLSGALWGISGDI